MQKSWRTDSVHEITPDEFFNLISSNTAHLEKTFPGTLSNCTTLQSTIAFIDACRENQSARRNFYYYLRNGETNMLMGYVCIKNIDPKLTKCELAYFIDKDFEGRGIITKAVGDVLAVCFMELMMNKVYICTSTVNFASQKIALKHNFIQEGILRDEFRNGRGELEDIVYFGLLKSDYQNV